VQERVSNDSDELRELGIDWLSVSGGGVEFFARDREAACALLRSRYGPAINPIWIAPDRLGEEPQYFASWSCEERQLTVFYPLPHNGEQPGKCTADEHRDRVVVHLTILAPQGGSTLIGGFKASHATVTLAEPIGKRSIIDAATGETRPRWDGRKSTA